MPWAFTFSLDSKKGLTKCILGPERSCPLPQPTYCASLFAPSSPVSLLPFLLAHLCSVSITKQSIFAWRRKQDYIEHTKRHLLIEILWDPHKSCIDKWWSKYLTIHLTQSSATQKLSKFYWSRVDSSTVTGVTSYLLDCGKVLGQGRAWMPRVAGIGDTWVAVTFTNWDRSISMLHQPVLLNLRHDLCPYNR